MQGLSNNIGNLQDLKIRLVFLPVRLPNVGGAPGEKLQS